MLDTAVEQQYILISIPEKFDSLRKRVYTKAENSHLSIIDLAEGSYDNSIIPANIQGAIFFNTLTIESNLFLFTLLKDLPKIFVLTDQELSIQHPSIEIYDVKYKKVGECIDQYIDALQNKNYNILVSNNTTGYHYTTYGDIKINPYEGLFVSIDYPDNENTPNNSIGTEVTLGIEKQLKLLTIQTAYTNEPTGEISGGIVRTAHAGRIELFPDAMQLLYTTDRIEHARQITQSLKYGVSVITARYALTTLAYAYKKLPLGFLLAANSQVYWPDISLVLSNPHVLPFSSHKEDVNEGLEFTTQLFTKTTHLLDITKGVDGLVKQAMRIIKSHPKIKNKIIEKE